MRFASIGSGSQGNGTLIDNGGKGAILLDCGFSARETRNRLAMKSLDIANLAGILVTHEHGDHAKGVAVLANTHRLPVYCTWGTYQAALSGRLDDALFHRIDPVSVFELAGCRIEAVAVPHDAREPCQYVISAEQQRLGILSDVGSFTRDLIVAYQGCDALMLECNHDLHMLAQGPYPAQLKRRVAGHYGHLNNQQAAEFLRQVAHPKLQHLIATHISQKNNTPELALEALAQAEVDLSFSVQVATQGAGFDWIEMTPSIPRVQNSTAERQLILDLEI